MALLICALAIIDRAGAADLRLRIHPKMERHDTIPPQQKREQLFERFLHWLRSHQG